MKKTTWFILLAFLALTALSFSCSSDKKDDTTPPPTDGDDITDGDTVDGDTTDGDTTDGDTTDGDEDVAKNTVGGTCEENANCATGFCLSSKSVKGLIPDYDINIPNGYCSVLMCKSDGTDERCPNGEVSFCASLYVFSGSPDYATSGLCLKPCATDADCRAADGQVCTDPQAWVTAGLLPQATVDQYFGDTKVCLPGELKAFAESLLAQMADGDTDTTTDGDVVEDGDTTDGDVVVDGDVVDGDATDGDVTEK